MIPVELWNKHNISQFNFHPWNYFEQTIEMSTTHRRKAAFSFQYGLLGYILFHPFDLSLLYRCPFKCPYVKNCCCMNYWAEILSVKISNWGIEYGKNIWPLKITLARRSPGAPGPRRVSNFTPRDILPLVLFQSLSKFGLSRRCVHL